MSCLLDDVRKLRANDPVWADILEADSKGLTIQWCNSLGVWQDGQTLGLTEPRSSYRIHPRHFIKEYTMSVTKFTPMARSFGRSAPTEFFDLLKAIQEGATLQSCTRYGGTWTDLESTSFSKPRSMYRIKPKPICREVSCIVFYNPTTGAIRTLDGIGITSPAPAGFVAVHMKGTVNEKV